MELKNTTRQILNESGGTITTGGNLPSFSYSGYAARLLTTQELSKGCNNLTVGNQTTGELDVCEYLMEDSNYSKTSGWSGGSGYYWLESPRASNSNHVWYVSGNNRVVYIYSAYYAFGVRPAVDILKSDISLQ